MHLWEKKYQQPTEFSIGQILISILKTDFKRPKDAFS